MTEVQHATEMTYGEMFDSLTGFDEIAIEDRFQMGLDVLSGKHQMRFTRGIIAVHLMREGLKKAEAFQRALEMPFGEVQIYFTPEPEDQDPEAEPATDAGKESGSSAIVPSSKPLSA